MLFSFVFLLLLHLTSSLVHNFQAEAHWICQVCQSSLSIISNSETSQVGLQQQSLETSIGSICKVNGTTFSTACSLFMVHFNQAIAQTKFKDSKTMSDIEFCITISMCDDTESSEYQAMREKFDIPVVNMTKIQTFNRNKGRSWTMGVNPGFVNATLNDIRNLLGSIVDPDHVYTLPEKQTEDLLHIGDDSFDPREEWPECKDVIGHIRDQSACGSCWAFGSTEAYNDRRCIKTGDTTLLSVEDTTACCDPTHCSSFGCDGGQPSLAWGWLANVGVVTGGDYGDLTTCLPYEFPPCSHHVDPTPGYPECPSAEYTTPTCGQSCSNGAYDKAYSRDKNRAHLSYNLQSVSLIMDDIKQYGSATAAFTVYEDFVNYKSGVYSHVYGQALGGHAIKMVGWGVEKGEAYWLIANSWNPTWGDQGFFKIKKGTNECGIEMMVSGGIP